MKAYARTTNKKLQNSCFQQQLNPFYASKYFKEFVVIIQLYVLETQLLSQLFFCYSHVINYQGYGKRWYVTSPVISAYVTQYHFFYHFCPHFITFWKLLLSATRSRYHVKNNSESNSIALITDNKILLTWLFHFRGKNSLKMKK